MGEYLRIGTYGTRRGVMPTSFPPNSFLVRKPHRAGVLLRENDVPELQHGQHLYLYNNIQTNQIVYSLTRHLNNKDSLDQLPYLGKKSVPARLRKDLWSPLAMVYFPSPHAGLAAYRKLREFRRLHETSYDLDLITEKQGKHAGFLYPTKKRGRILMNQKANSVADLAAVLIQQEKGPSADRKASAGRRIKRAEQLKQQKGASKIKKNPLDVRKELGGVQGVCVRWADMLDAEFAETWPEEVVHDTLQKSRHTAAWPVTHEPVVQEAKGVDQEQAIRVEEEQPPPQGKRKWLDSVTSWRPWRQQDTPVATA